MKSTLIDQSIVPYFYLKVPISYEKNILEIENKFLENSDNFVFSHDRTVTNDFIYLHYIYSENVNNNISKASTYIFHLYPGVILEANKKANKLKNYLDLIIKSYDNSDKLPFVYTKDFKFENIHIELMTQDAMSRLVYMGALNKLKQLIDSDNEMELGDIPSLLGINNSINLIRNRRYSLLNIEIADYYYKYHDENMDPVFNSMVKLFNYDWYNCEIRLNDNINSIEVNRL